MGILTDNERLAERMIDNQLRITGMIASLFPNMREMHQPKTQPSLQHQPLTPCVPDDAPADSVLVEQVAEALARAVQAAKAEDVVGLDGLTIADGERLRTAAHVAWMLLSQEQQQVAQFVAAEQLIAERTGGNHSWRTASSQARRLAWGDAHVACTSYRQWLMGILPSEWEQRAKQALAEMKAGGAR